ncbi:MAG: 16S rRNA (cytosine(967)-C(5))-methyltransferase RsmB [Solirubrobacteraceae bacterium]
MAGVSPARACAYTVVRRVFEHGAYADRAFQGEARGLETRERSLAMTLAYGAVQRRATLDHVAGLLADRPPAKLDPPVLAALRLGLMQVLFLDGIADHAAVHESVELVKRDLPAGRGLVNAVLRRAVRERDALLAGLDDATPAGAAIRHSVPRWLAELWWQELGGDRARRLLATVNEPAESAVRVNTLAISPADLAATLGVCAHPAPGIPEGLVLDGPFDAHASSQWSRGELMPQSRGSMLVSRMLAPQPGERVLDLCAAPGGKTTHLAALMDDRGELTAVERHRGRAQSLRRTLERMHVRRATVEVADASAPRAQAQQFDRVLVDPPCSGLGTLQSRPDLRWRTSPEQIAELATVQARVLRAGAAATAPGGQLVYSVCTISRAESEEVVDGFLAEHPGWSEDSGAGGASARDAGGGRRYRHLAPDTDGTDGFFVARLRRAGG